jgi:hypothetical protein
MQSGVAPAGALGTIALHIAPSARFVITLDEQARGKRNCQNALIGWDRLDPFAR